VYQLQILFTVKDDMAVRLTNRVKWRTKWPGPVSSHCPDIRLEGLRKIMKTQKSLYPDEIRTGHLNECRSEVSLLQPCCSVRYLLTH